MTDQTHIDDVFLELKHWRVVRIDGNKHATKEKIIEYLDTFPIYVLGIERVPKLHYHIVVGTDSSDVYGVQNKKLKQRIKNLFSLSGSKGEFSTSSVRTTIRKSIMYSIKDCEYFSKGLKQVYVQAISIQSTKKFKRKEFSDKIQKLEDDFYDDKITIEEFNSKYRHMKIIEYGQTPNPVLESKYIAKHYMKKNENSFKTYCSTGLSQVYSLIGEYDDTNYH